MNNLATTSLHKLISAREKRRLKKECTRCRVQAIAPSHAIKYTGDAWDALTEHLLAVSNRINYSPSMQGKLMRKKIKDLRLNEPPTSNCDRVYWTLWAIQLDVECDIQNKEEKKKVINTTHGKQMCTWLRVTLNGEFHYIPWLSFFSFSSFSSSPSHSNWTLWRII